MVKKGCIIVLSLLSLISFGAIARPYRENNCWSVQAEFLYWWISKNNTNVPLVTSAALTDPLPGALGQPGTKIQLSSCNINPRNNAGFRFLVGALLDECKAIDLEMSYFLLPTHHSQRSSATSGQPGSANLAVPVFDITGVWGLNGLPGETIAVLPGPLFGDPGFEGAFKLCGATKFQGAELNATFPVYAGDCAFLVASGGFGWMQFLESLSLVGQTYTTFNASIPSGFFNFTDQFKTKNNFYGFLFGIRGEYIHTTCRLETVITGGIGLMRNQHCINGESQTITGNLFFLTLNSPGQVLSGGIFTQPSNIGSCRRNKFGGMLETIIRGGYSVHKHIELTLGYNFILLSQVARAADQIDRKINSTRTSLADDSRATVGIGPGPIPFGMSAAAPLAFGDERPLPFFRTKKFWVQGLIVGLNVHF